MRTRIKLCGFSTQDTVLAASKAGADALGFVFYPPSPRHVELDQAVELVRCMGAWQSPVALFVNPEPALVHAVIKRIPQVVLQFHGDESPEFCNGFAHPYVKAVRMKAGVNLLEQSRLFPNAQALLVDSWSESYGGTGHTFDWSLLPKEGELKQGLVLSGGLDETNVANAIQSIKPYGVDVSSGIESQRGVKSIDKIEAFCKAVFAVDAKQL